MSIRKGDTLIAGSVATNPKPNWINHDAISNSAFNTGWTVPADGQLILRLENKTNTSKTLYVNNIEIFIIPATGASNIPTLRTVLAVGQGDVVKIANTGTSQLTNSCIFVPYKIL